MSQKCAQVTRYLGYSSLKDFFPTMDIKPNPGCANPLCGQRQAEAAARAATPEARAAAAAAAEAASAAEATAPVHDDNDWGIEVVAEQAGPSSGGGGGGGGYERIDNGGAGPGGQAPPRAPAEGLQYSMPVRCRRSANGPDGLQSGPLACHNICALK